MEYFNNTKSVLSKFTKMVHGRFGFDATFHTVKKSANNGAGLIKVIEDNKYAKIIVYKNHVIMPIEQFGVVLGYVKIENGVALKQNHLMQVSDLSDLLVKTMIVSEKNKRIQLIIEDIIQSNLSSVNELDVFSENQVNHLKVLKTNLPVLVLSNTHLSAKNLAMDLHSEHKSDHFVIVDDCNISYFKTHKSISTFKNCTIYISELADLEKQSQLAFEHYLKIGSSHGPKVIACTIFDPIHLVKKQIVRQELIYLLSGNRILSPEDECRLEDKSTLTKYLFSSLQNKSKISLLPGI